jgi:hypothetical protein
MARYPDPQEISEDPNPNQVNSQSCDSECTPNCCEPEDDCCS